MPVFSLRFLQPPPYPMDIIYISISIITIIVVFIMFWMAVARGASWEMRKWTQCSGFHSAFVSSRMILQHGCRAILAAESPKTPPLQTPSFIQTPSPLCGLYFKTPKSLLLSPLYSTIEFNKDSVEMNGKSVFKLYKFQINCSNS